MRRLGVIAALGALLAMAAGAAASPALAAGRGDGWQLVSFEPMTLSGYCAFDVELTIPAANEFTKLLKTADGSMTFLATGSVTATFTNLATGKAITENVSGPGTFTVNPDNSLTIFEKGREIGPMLLPGQAAAFGLPPLSVTDGALHESVDANGNVTSASLNGHVALDVCAALS